MSNVALFNCEWIATAAGNFRCLHCRTIRRIKTVRVCRARTKDLPQFKPAKRLRCVHLGAALGQSVKVSCSGCQKFHAVFACGVFGRCLPTFKGPFDADHQTEAALYHLCAGCDRKEFPPPPAAD